MITPAGLAALLRDSSVPQPTVLDVRWRVDGPPGIESYRTGHLPGAAFLDIDTQLSGPPGTGGRHPLPDPADLELVLRSVGVREECPVIVYDDRDSSVAARAWWLLRWAGHREVAVLDGGFAAWFAEGRPVTTGTPEFRRGNIEVRAGQLPVIDADGAAGWSHDGVLLDARTRQRYTGESEPVDSRAGHVPGAVHAPFSAHVNAAGRWYSPEELGRYFADLGVGPATPVAAYCGSGITASSVVLALELAGHPDPAALYPGSWSEWSADPARPRVTGLQPD